MSVIRINHQKNYVVINKDVLENKKLSFKAKGLWAYCMSRPDSWEFHVSHLITVSEDKEKAVYAALKELEIQGYLRKIQSRTNGKFGKFDYEISEIQIILPLPGFRDAEKRRAEKEALVSNNSKQVMKESNPPLPPPKEPRPATTKEEWKKRISSKWTDEEFDFAWNKLTRSSVQITVLQPWLETTLQNYRDSKVFSGDSGERTKKHKEFAYSQDYLMHRGDRVTALPDKVEFTSGSYYKAVAYNVTDEEWEEQTGWRRECEL